MRLAAAQAFWDTPACMQHTLRLDMHRAVGCGLGSYIERSDRDLDDEKAHAIQGDASMETHEVEVSEAGEAGVRARLWLMRRRESALDETAHAARQQTRGAHAAAAGEMLISGSVLMP